MDSDEVNITLCGGAGQGIQTIEALLTPLLQKGGLNVFATKEYMSRVRGGLNSTTIRISKNQIRAYNHHIDLLIALEKGAVKHLGRRVNSTTQIIGDPGAIGELDNALKVPFRERATQIGSEIYSNVIALGAICKVLGIDKDMVTQEIGERFAIKGDEVISANNQAIDAGYQIGQELIENGLAYEIEPNRMVKNQMLLTGHQAIALGAIAGGCNFISAYPMSPSTGVLVDLAKHSHRFGIALEQAEDEISAINMCLGASYAGAKAMTSTSGGGFALMQEGVSLAGMIELPIVIHIAQRPGPATGLPTRTEQGDLSLAVYSGHGEFPRMVYAPGNIEQAYEMTQVAFHMTEKYQSPSFILTDQYLMDMYYNIGRWDIKNIRLERSLFKTDIGYERYTVTESGTSPRGIPGWGKGLVYCDSDEHDETGRITEDASVRTEQMNKRRRKAKGIDMSVLEPQLIGEKSPNIMVVCWGSTLGAVEEAARSFQNDALISVLHFKQVYPLPNGLTELLENSRKTLLVEGNATGQFGQLIKIKTGHEFSEKALKYDGFPFSVEEVQKAIREML